MELRIRIDKPRWDPNPQKSKTNNHEWRKCVIVTFPNCSFEWIPTYAQLDEIKASLNAVEEINRELAQIALSTTRDKKRVI